MDRWGVDRQGDGQAGSGQKNREEMDRRQARPGAPCPGRLLQKGQEVRQSEQTLSSAAGLEGRGFHVQWALQEWKLQDTTNVQWLKRTVITGKVEGARDEGRELQTAAA